MGALHCSGCNHSFPVDYAHYRQCPDCKAQTQHEASGEPMSDRDAKHIAFEAYYRDREEQQIAAAVDDLIHSD